MTPPPLVLPPLRKTITVRWSPEIAFRRFTAEMGTWWPLRTHSVGGRRTRTVVFEPHVGGRIYEVMHNGEEATWGCVTVWDPPRRTAFTWHPGQPPERAQAIEVEFVPDGKGTRLELTHTGWERLGADARKARRGYPIGWAYVLRLWAGQRFSPLVLVLDALIWGIRLVRR